MNQRQIPTDSLASMEAALTTMQGNAGNVIPHKMN